MDGRGVSKEAPRPSMAHPPKSEPPTGKFAIQYAPAHPFVSETYGDSNSYDGGIEAEKSLAGCGSLVGRSHVVDGATTGSAPFVI